MLEVVNLIVGVIGVVATVIGTVVAIQQLRLQRQLAAPVTDDQPAPPPDWEPEPVTSSQPWSADRPEAARPARAERGFRVWPAPVRWAVVLLLLLALYFASLTTLGLVGLPFPTLAHRLYVGTICAHVVLAPALLALFVARGKARTTTMAGMAILAGLFLYVRLSADTSGCLETIAIALALTVIVLLALPASGRHFALSTGQGHRRHPVRRRRLITAVAVLAIIDGLLLATNAIYIIHYDNTQVLVSALPSPPDVGALRSYDRSAVSIDELATYFPDQDAALRHFHDHGAKKAAVAHWTTPEQQVLIMLVELADEETATNYVATIAPEGMIARGSFGPPNSAWFTREDPDEGVVVSACYAAESALVGIVYVWDYAESDGAAATALARDLMERV